MYLRIRAEEKGLLLRAVALTHTGLTDFVVRHALLAAKAVIERAIMCTCPGGIACLRRTRNSGQPLASCRSGRNRAAMARSTAAKKR
jgi:hypothetical protein